MDTMLFVLDSLIILLSLGTLVIASWPFLVKRKKVRWGGFFLGLFMLALGIINMLRNLNVIPIDLVLFLRVLELLAAAIFGIIYFLRRRAINRNQSNHNTVSLK